MSTFLIYGATGYSAGLILEHLDFASLPGQVIIAGRDGAKLQLLAKKWKLDYQVFALEDASTIDRHLQYCNTNYLDISAELESYILAEDLDQQAKDAGIVLLPGCGVCVTVMTGLTAHILKRIPRPLTVNTALFMPGSITPGTANSAGGGDQTLRRLIRSNGHLFPGTSGGTKGFDFHFDSGPVSTVMFGLPDLVALWHTFKVPNITSYVYLPASSTSGDNESEGKPIDGPSPEERRVNRMRASVEVIAADGTIAHSVLETDNGYTMTARMAAEAVRRVLNGELKDQGGFHTTVSLFGDHYIKTFNDVDIADF